MALLHLNFYSPTLEQNARVFVALPEPDKLDGTPLKTVWMLHGFSGDCTDWQRKTGIERHAIARNLAIILPDAGNSFYADMAYGPAWFTYLTQELPDYLARLLPLSRRREDCFIGGLSSGGYGAMKIGLTYPERFTAIGCLSAYNIPADFSWQYADKPPEWRRMFSLVYGDLFPDRVLGTEHDLCYLIRRIRETGAPRPRIFHIWGDRDVARRGALLMNRDFLAMDDPFPYFGAEYPGAHDFDFWDAHLEEMFDWFGLK